MPKKKEILYEMPSDMERMFEQAAYTRTLGGGSHDDLVMAILGDESYVQRFKMPKWNREVTILDVPEAAIRHWHTLGIPTSKSAHRQRAAYFQDLKTRFDSEYNKFITAGEKIYGTHGSLISGGFREDWPDDAKDIARFLAHGSSVLADAVHLHAYLSKTRSPAFQ